MVRHFLNTNNTSAVLTAGHDPKGEKGMERRGKPHGGKHEKQKTKNIDTMTAEIEDINNPAGVLEILVRSLRNKKGP